MNGKTARLLRFMMAKDRALGHQPPSKRSVYRRYLAQPEAVRAKILAKIRRMKKAEEEYIL